jgi:hypothetical protein
VVAVHATSQLFSRGAANERGESVFASTLSAGGLLLGRYSPQGEQVWEREFVADDRLRVADVAMDASGRIAVLGELSGFIEVEGVELRGRIFLGRFAPDGAPLWSRAFGATEGLGTINGHARAMSVAAAGDVWITGSYHHGPMDFSADPALELPSEPDGYQHFIVRLRFGTDP